MRVAELPPTELSRRLRDEGLLLRTGPFLFRIRSPLPGLARGLGRLYAEFETVREGLADFHLRVAPVRGLRRWWRPQINFWMDGYAPFKPLSADHGFALLEWGMNWCIAGGAHQYLMLHAACLERNGRCVILPGEPGAGKSTLTAALSLSGWRLLSDEITLIDPRSGRLYGLARPVSLKNASIEVIRRFAPEAVMGEVAHDTHKGDVAHLQPTSQSVASAMQAGRPAFIVFPRWRDGSALQKRVRAPASAFETVARNAFNYSLLGRRGFESLATLIDASLAWDFEYSRLDEALPAFEQLMQRGWSDD